MKNKIGLIYFPTPNRDGSREIVEFLESYSELTHLGKSDPPKKSKYSIEIFMNLYDSITENNKWLFARMRNGFDVSLTFYTDPRWDFSSLSFTAIDDDNVDNFIIKFTSRFESTYLSICGKIDGGKNQNWRILYRSSSCPLSILIKIQK